MDAMVDRKTDVSQAVRGQPIRAAGTTPSKHDAQVVHAKLQPEEEALSLDDGDFGTDPYNRTGRFTVLKRD